jgi:hypothetical protein
VNEQINKLWNTACAEVQPEMDGICMTNQRGQKFAELIVQECLNICEDMGDNGKDGHYCADKITKTFLR